MSTLQPETIELSQPEIPNTNNEEMFEAHERESTQYHENDSIFNENQIDLSHLNNHISYTPESDFSDIIINKTLLSTNKKRRIVPSQDQDEI